MLDFLSKLIGGRRKSEFVHPKTVAAETVLGDFASAVGDESREYSGDTHRRGNVPIAPRDERVSFAAMEKPPVLPGDVVDEEESTVPDSNPAPARAAAPAPKPSPAPQSAAPQSEKGWDLLRDDNW